LELHGSDTSVIPDRQLGFGDIRLNPTAGLSDLTMCM
jgi:hypothetical protein